MSAGTIKLTNGSTAVVGTGSAFTSDLKSGDVITATVGGIFFTLFVDAVTSNTALTLTDPFTGPTTSALAWVAVPQLTLNRITAALAAQTAESVRRVLQENANWQAFYSGTGDITVTLPDGSPAGRPLTGPSWAKMSSALGSAVQWRGNLPSTANLNTYGPTSAGQWGSGVANMLAANGFPEDGAQGVFEVFQGGTYGCAQRYFSNSGNAYYRRLSGSWNGTDGPWGPWLPVGFCTMPGLFSGDMNTLVSPGLWSINTTVTNGPTVAGTPIVGVCEVILRNSSSTVLQRFTNMTSSSGYYNYTWQRTLYGTTWSPWELLGTKALNDLGIGIPVSQSAGFNWQTASFQNGALLNVNSANWVNPPPLLSSLPGTSLFLQVTGRAGMETASGAWVMVTATQLLNNGTRRVFNICGYGAIGSRVFTTTEVFTTNTIIPVANGGTGSSSPFGNGAGQFTQGNDSRLATVGGKTGGTISSSVDVSGALSVIGQSSSYGEMAFKYPGTLQKMTYAFCENYGDLVFVTTQAANAGTEKYFSFRGDKFTTPGNITCVSLTQTSDADKKDDIKPIENALDKVLSLDGVTFNWKDGGLPSAGVIAQQLIDVLPEAVGAVFDDHNHYAEVEEEREFEEEQPFEEEGEGGDLITVYRTVTVKRMVKVNRLVKPLDESKRSYTVEYSGVVALCLQAIKELNAKVATLEKKLNPQEAEEQPDVQQ